MKKQGSGQRRLFKIRQWSESIKHTIIKRLNGVWVQVCVEEMIDRVEENEREGRWKRMVKEWRSLKRPDGRETRLLEWRECENKDEERNGWNEESLKINKFGKTRKDTRWKRGEFVVAERVRKQSESEDGGMRELRDIWGCWGWKTLQREGLSVDCYWEMKNKWKWNRGREGERNGMRIQVVKTFKNTWRKGGETVGMKGNRRVMWRFVRKKWRRN